MEMDMPDADELEWLAFQQHQYIPEEDEHDFDHIPPSPPLTSNEELQSSTENAGCRKRLWPDTIHLNGDEDPERRKKTAHIEAEPQIMPVDEEWLQHPPEHANLVSGEAVTEKMPNVDELLPRRTAADIEGDCMPVTGPSGDRVYAKLKGTDCLSSSFPKSIADTGRSSKGLLSESIHVMLERVEQEMFEQACRATTEAINDENHLSDQPTNEQLWVDKYAPKSFTELLSDEQTNREVLHWLKQWDPCVFGSKNISTSSEVLSALRRHSSLSQSHRVFGNNKFSFKGRKGVQLSKTQDNVHEMNGLNQMKDNHNNITSQLNKKQVSDVRPDEKILLLCGPPGLGKTTLAHVAARHCGYRVVEVNASDDRSASTMEGKILDVVQMNSVMADSKPKCLVIDEIDGALGEGKGAVEVLLKMISSEKKLDSWKENDVSDAHSTRATKKKGSGKTGRLSRPVICICNDLFVPALRSLRQVARVHTFVQPNTSRVVNRLKYICNKEGFRASAQGLTALAEYTECDIRSCLNTLQFLKKKNQVLNVVDIGSQVVGRKDMTSNIFDIWREVLQKQKPKVKITALNSCERGTEDFARLHNLISSHGDYELGAEGIHENFLHVRYHDSAMDKTVQCLDFLCDSDFLKQGTQRFSLNAYQPSFIIAIQRLIAQVETPNIQWPKSFQRYRATLIEKKDLVKTWLNSISPTISRSLSLNSLVQDFISLLLHILAPPTLRPVASQLLSKNELEEINQLVDTMIDYAVTYKKSRVPPSYGSHREDVTLDTLRLCFDPPIDDFVKFKDYTSSHRLLSLAMQQILFHEVEKQKIVRESIARTIRANKTTMQQGAHNSAENATCVSQAKLDDSSDEILSMSTRTNIELKRNMASITNTSKSGGSTEGALVGNASALIIGPKPALVEAAKKPFGIFNFFDRFKRSSHRGSESAEKSSGCVLTSVRDSRPLVFKFNEGFTNAVKRPVRLHELL